MIADIVKSFYLFRVVYVGIFKVPFIPEWEVH